MSTSGSSQGDRGQTLFAILGGVIGGMAVITSILIASILVIRSATCRSRNVCIPESIYDLPDFRLLPPPVNTIPSSLKMHTNDAYSESPMNSHKMGTQLERAMNNEYNTKDDIKAGVVMQENEAYQPTNDLLCHPVSGTDAVNASDHEILMNKNSRVANEINSLSDSVEGRVQERKIAEKSGAACANAVMLIEIITNESTV